MSEIGLCIIYICEVPSWSRQPFVSFFYACILTKYMNHSVFPILHDPESGNNFFQTIFCSPLHVCLTSNGRDRVGETLESITKNYIICIGCSMLKYTSIVTFCKKYKNHDYLLITQFMWRQYRFRYNIRNRLNEAVLKIVAYVSLQQLHMICFGHISLFKLSKWFTNDWGVDISLAFIF